MKCVKTDNIFVILYFAALILQTCKQLHLHVCLQLADFIDGEMFYHTSITKQAYNLMPKPASKVCCHTIQTLFVSMYIFYKSGLSWNHVNYGRRSCSNQWYIKCQTCPTLRFHKVMWIDQTRPITLLLASVFAQILAATKLITSNTLPFGLWKLSDILNLQALDEIQPWTNFNISIINHYIL